MSGYFTSDGKGLPMAPYFLHTWKEAPVLADYARRYKADRSTLAGAPALTDAILDTEIDCDRCGHTGMLANLSWYAEGGFWGGYCRGSNGDETMTRDATTCGKALKIRP